MLGGWVGPYITLRPGINYNASRSLGMQSDTIQRQEGGRRTSGDIGRGQPLVSVIVVVRNGKNDIEKALASVFAQSKDICELIVIDGVSTDGTLDIIKKYNNVIDCWMSEPDSGVYDAMNKGVQLARGRYIYFLGSDDLLIVNLDSLASVLVDPNTIYYGDVRTPSSECYDGPWNAWKLARCTINHQAIFYPSVAFETEGFCTDYKVLADHAFNLRCFGNKQLHFQYIPYLIAYYSDAGMSTRVADTAFLRDRLSLIRRYLPWHIYLVSCLRDRVRRLVKGY
jgi:glycosyltransferase involved in cell wall biosynthesis